MTFEVAGEAYDRFMGRYSGPLAVRFVDWLDVEAGRQAIDVGCGPGALTGVLVDRLGAAHVAALEPTDSFVRVPYLHGVGPVGEAVAALDDRERARVEDLLREDLGDGPFEITAVAFAIRGRA